MSERIIDLKNKPSVLSFASVAGKKESKGPLFNLFDEAYDDTTMGQDSWERAESLLQKNAIKIALQKGNLSSNDIDLIFAGDLINQCIGSSFGVMDFSIPFAGVYGACSTMALSLAMAAMSVNAGYAKKAIAVTSSHFCSAEKQFRKPLEYGGQRPPSAQWTVTGSGCVILSDDKLKNSPKISKIAIGKIKDMGITDPNNMGAAMAPAACDTIERFLTETNTKPENYDLILTGDLGAVGSQLLKELLKKQHNIDISKVHNDCGLMIYNIDEQDVNSGGSGCGCSGIVLCSKILNDLLTGNLKKVLFVATGALLSQTSSLQGEPIPGVAHGVLITGGEYDE